MDSGLGQARIEVEEVVVYETGVMGGFEGEFGELMRVYNGEEDEGEDGGGVVWVVVFSPTGCEAMLRVLGFGPFASGDGARIRTGNGNGRVFVATIGPTTRDFLRQEFGFEPHVCAAKPTPQGILEGIQGFVGV
jgi:uroporphyrinogen-III synthase